MPRPIHAAIATAAVLTLAACSNGATPEASPTATYVVPEAPSGPYIADPVWTIDIASESWSTPADLGEVVAVGANDGIVRGINAADGSLVWETVTGGPIRGGIAADEGTAYLVSDDGSLYAVADDGEVEWTVSLDAAPASRGDYDNYGSRPVVADGVVFAATYTGVVAAVDQESGEILWSVAVGSPVETGLALGEGRLHVSTMGGNHMALATADGSLVWEMPTGGAATTTPAIMGDSVIVGSRGAKLLVLDEATGAQQWVAGFGGSWVQSGAVPISDSQFVTGSSDYKAVRAFELATGGPVWLSRVGGWTWAVPAVADGVVIASEIRLDYHTPLDTALWAFDAETGAELWTAGSGPALEWAPDGYGAYGNGAGPVVVDELVIVPGLDGVVRAFPLS